MNALSKHTMRKKVCEFMRVIQASSKQKRTHPRKVISYLDIQQILKAYEYKAIK